MYQYPVASLDEHVREMKALAKLLVPYSYPFRPPDNDIVILKQREIVADGYTFTVHFSRADYQGVYLDMLTMVGRNAPFLPMEIICKVAGRFLGEKELAFVECMTDGRKIYTWMALYRKDGIPIINNYLSGEDDSYNGLDFVRIKHQPVVIQHPTPGF